MALADQKKNLKSGDRSPAGAGGFRRAMDYWKAVQELQVEKQRLDHAIASLEALVAGGEMPPVSRRGRKHMPEEERHLVSERMKAYWAERKLAKGKRSKA
jgi:hypothetical protein